MSDSGRTLSDPCEKCRKFHNGPCKPAATGSWESHADECTPPASQPTVELDRETFDREFEAFAAAVEGNRLLSSRTSLTRSDAAQRIREFRLALLRAADQK